MRSKSSLVLSLACVLALVGVGSAQTENKSPPNHSFALSPDGLRFASRDRAGAVRLWNVKSGESRLAQKLPLAAGDLAFSPDGQYLAEGGEGRIRLRFLPCPKGDRTLKLEPGERVQALAFQPGGKLLAVSLDGVRSCKGGLKSEVRLYDLEKLERVQTLQGGGAVAFSADGKRLAVGGEGVSVWEMATGRAVYHLLEPAGVVKSLTFSPDGKLLAALYPEGVQVWNAADGKQGMLIRPILKATVRQFFFSPDSKRVYFSNGSGLTQYEVKKGFALAQLIPLEGARPLGFLADGRTLVLHRDDTLLLRDEQGKMTAVPLQ